MSFTSYEFIAFLLILFPVYYLVRSGYRWIALLIASYAFYLMADARYVFFMFFSTVTVYAAARVIQSISDRRDAFLAGSGEISVPEKKAYKLSCKSRQKKWLIACIVLNIGILAWAKYANFLLENVGPALKLFDGDSLSCLIIMPMGISYYTLKSVGYVIDVYRNVVKAEKNFFKYALFVSFFPQIVQGPISRYSDLSGTLYAGSAFDFEAFSCGLQRILWGFFKKLVIADCVSAGVETITGDPESYTGAYIFALIFLYTLQLYADFTGGIDITIGVAQALGIRVHENFIRPFFSKSLKEYWRRWHITMGAWFKDYVFFSVSASKWIKRVAGFFKNRAGAGAGKRVSVYTASFVTWAATGIWHGASLGFLVWGLANWFILMVSEELEPVYDRFHARFHLKEKKGYKVFEALRTFLLVCCLNLFVSGMDLRAIARGFASVVTVHNRNILFDGSMLNIGLSISDWAVLAAGTLLMFAVSLLQRKESVRSRIARQPLPVRTCVWCGLFVAVIVFGTYGIGYDKSNFIYNRF